MKVKKILSAILLLGLILSLAACGGSKKHEDTVKSFLDTYKSGDLDKVSSFLETDDGILSSIKKDNDSEDNKRIVEALTSKLKYKINSSTVDGDSAIVSVDMENVDMENAMQNVIAELFNSMVTMTDESEMDEKLSSLLEEQLFSDNAKTITNTVDIKLNKVDGDWKIVSDASVYDGMTGNFASFSRGMADAFSGLGE